MTFTSLPKAKFIELDPPNFLQFDDIPKKSSIAYLKIRNVHSSDIIFKIKTTAPKSYIVRPNQVVLEPDETIEIQFYMNPTETYPSVLNSKDRFLIAATDIGDEFNEYNRATIWTDKPSSSIQQYKLSATFKNPTASIVDNNTSIFLEKPSKYESLPKFTNTPQSRGSIEPSLDNLNAIENKNLTQSVKSNENYSSFHHKELEKSLRDSYTSREPYRESYKEPFKESAKDFYKGSYKENIRENYSGRFNSDQINQYYQSPRHFHQSNQVIQHNQTNHMLGTSNIMNKSFSGPLSETDSGHDYKKEYERLLSKVEEQEKQLLKYTEERNQVFNELSSLRENLSKKKTTPKALQAQDGHGFQLIHVILVAVVSLLLGALFSV